jgi:hypothetical protein
MNPIKKLYDWATGRKNPEASQDPVLLFKSNHSLDQLKPYLCERLHLA